MLRRAGTSIAIFAVCYLGPVSSAYSDQFQIRDRATRSPIGFVKIGVAGRTFYTDNQGRVSIDLARGPYTIEIPYKGTTRRIAIQIDGAQVIKMIELD